MEVIKSKIQFFIIGLLIIIGMVIAYDYIVKFFATYSEYILAACICILFIAILKQNPSMLEYFKSKLESLLGLNIRQSGEKSSSKNMTGAKASVRPEAHMRAEQISVEDMVKIQLSEIRQQMTSLQVEIKQLQDDYEILEKKITPNNLEPHIAKTLSHNSNDIALIFTQLLEINRENIAKYIEKSSTPKILYELNSRVGEIVKAEITKYQKANSVNATVPPRTLNTQSPQREALISRTLPSATSSGVDIWYAFVPQGNIFHRTFLKFQPFETLYEIRPDRTSTNSGTFCLTNHSETLEHAFSMVDNLRDACDLVGHDIPTPKTMRVVKPGIVERSGEQWIIKEKLVLDWGDYV